MQADSEGVDAPPWTLPETDGPPWRVEVTVRTRRDVTTIVREEPGPRGRREVVTVVREETARAARRVRVDEPRQDALPDSEPPVQRPLEPPETRPRPVRLLLSRPYESPSPNGPYSSRNYAAVEAGGGFGLIDLGSAMPGVRDLVAHIPKGVRSDPLRALRVGGVFEAAGRGQALELPLRVRYLTPARYYAPGRKITTLGLGVDDRAWRQLVVNPE